MHFRPFCHQGKEPRVVCPTHEEIDSITEAIRPLGKAPGRLAESFQLRQDVFLSWTAAQKSEIRNLLAGSIAYYR